MRIPKWNIISLQIGAKSKKSEFNFDSFKVITPTTSAFVSKIDLRRKAEIST